MASLILYYSIDRLNTSIPMESYLLEHEATLRVSAFLLVLAAMASWERLAPARAPGEPWWRRWRTNLGLAAFNTLLLRLLLPTSAIGVASFAQAEGWGLLNRYGVEGWIAVALAVLALDFVIYLQHVLFHAVPALARLHQVHHADPDFTAPPESVSTPSRSCSRC
jgi:sterol desaturase/sphingolipid hydroxylase (fatty acid hydroxylase superfamily)